MNQSKSENNEAFCIHRLTFFSQSKPKRAVVFFLNKGMEMKQIKRKRRRQMNWKKRIKLFILFLKKKSDQKEATSWNRPLASCRVPDLPVPVTPAL